MKTHIDLFSGIGGFALAAQWAGFKTEVFCEKDEFCQRVLRKHWPDVPIVPSVEDFKGEQYHPERMGQHGVTLITGGPPCQGTSVAAAIQGKRTGETLWPEMERVCREVFPDWIIIEQPPGNKKWESEVAASLEKIGYHSARFERQASDCGAPHPRRRMFIVANSSCQRLITLAGVRGTHKAEKAAWPSPPRGAWRSTRTGDSGVDDGVSNWVDRLKSLGNAIVPAVAFEIIKRIMEIENGNKTY